MSLSFFINNFHFAIELMGAVIFLMAAWLAFDSYLVRRDSATFTRAIGFSLYALWQILYAMSGGSDVLSYISFCIFLIALLLVLVSFLRQERLQVTAIIVLPTFAAWNGSLRTAAALLLFAIAYYAYRTARQEFNKTWEPFYWAFTGLGVGTLCGIFAGNQTSVAFIAELLFDMGAFILLARWVWQYLQLRIRESLILIFISAALLLSTIVTLAFSTILINQITSETEANLLTDARVLDLDIAGLKEQSSAKVALIARDALLAQAVAKNDFTTLSTLAEQYMEINHLGFLIITDKQGNVLVRAHALSRRGDSLAEERAFEEAILGNTFVTIEESPVEKFSIRAGAPILEGGKIVGTVIGGYPLDNPLVDNIKRVTGLEMFIYQKDVAVAATALATDGRTRITGSVLTDKSVAGAVLTTGSSMTAHETLAGQPFLASYLPLSNGDGKIVGMIGAAKPEQDILDISNATNRLTLMTVILIMLVLVYPIYRFTKRLTTE